MLEEYRSTEVPLSASAAHQLQMLAGPRLGVTPTECTGLWTVTATAHVGTVVVPGLQLLIRPKVKAANLFHMLEPDGQALTIGVDLFDYEANRDLLSAVATFFSRLVEWTFVRGVSRDYLERDERLVTVRGRVDVKEQLRILGLPLPLACRYDEHSVDVRVNRVVRAAGERLLTLPGVVPSTRRRLTSLLGRIDEASRLQRSDIAGEPSFTRLNEHYRAVDGLARLILAGSGITDAAGGARAGVFLIDMNKLFERFIESRLRSLLRPRIDVYGQEGTYLDTERKVGMRPDLVFRRTGKIVYVGDTKYKLSKSGYGREGDYYQLLAYTTALGVPEGVLVYCHQEETEPRSVLVDQAGKTLRTAMVSLSGSPSAVDAEVAAVADLIAERVQVIGSIAS